MFIQTNLPDIFPAGAFQVADFVYGHRVQTFFARLLFTVVETKVVLVADLTARNHDVFDNQNDYQRNRNS
jgi:hypothetical protein